MLRGTRLALGFAFCLAATAVLPAAAMAGSISGTVTAENGGAPIAGVEVCPRREPYAETECATTDSAGHYSLGGLIEGSYKINFSANRANLKYVSEFYDNKRYSDEADLVSVGASENVTVDAQLAEGGSISGTLTEDGTGDPVVGVVACAWTEGRPARCSRSDVTGSYQLNGLRSGEYVVEFEGGNQVNYLTEFYKDANLLAEAEKVEVEAPNAVTGIDEQLSPGAQILGHVSEVGTEIPLSGKVVCAEAQEGGFEDCETTDATGDYALRSLPAGSYLVAFGIEDLPFGVRRAGQWWQGAASKDEATAITIAPPETRSGIDGQLPNPYAAPNTERIVVTTVPAPTKRPAKCRKHFHRKKVHGKWRCVKKHRRTHMRPHRHHCRKGFHGKKVHRRWRCVKEHRGNHSRKHRRQHAAG